MTLKSIELCAGAGGQALGLEWAGFEHLCLVEIDRWACETLRMNRDGKLGRALWNVIESDIRDFDAAPFRGQVDLVAAGVPCPPFSKAGAQLGEQDDRNLFGPLLKVVSACRPEAILVENVRGLLDSRFEEYRSRLNAEIAAIDPEYSDISWRILNACDFGVPQLRPRAIGVVLKRRYLPYFEWPEPFIYEPPTVGQSLFAEMSSRGWGGAAEWARKANKIAPTLVGGSRKHGGADLGPTRAKREWAKLGVDALVLADSPPAPEFAGRPRLTVRMAATLQGFPTDWIFSGGKTAAYRQVGNAFPPAVAREVGRAIAVAFRRSMLDDLEAVS